MPSPDYRTALIDYIRAQARPPDKFSHQARLYALAVSLASDAPFDDDVLFAAAWMHDLGVFVGHRPEDLAALASWDHVAYVFRTAPPVLTGLGFPTHKIPPVLEAIRTHLPHTEPTSFKGVLLRDADLLEQLGAVGILRTVSKVGRDTRFIRFADALRVLRLNLETLPSLLKLDASRRLATPRIELLRVFLEQAAAETRQIEW
jgi:uncharacterized protein